MNKLDQIRDLFSQLAETEKEKFIAEIPHSQLNKDTTNYLAKGKEKRFGILKKIWVGLEKKQQEKELNKFRLCWEHEPELIVKERFWDWLFQGKNKRRKTQQRSYYRLKQKYEKIWSTATAEELKDIPVKENLNIFRRSIKNLSGEILGKETIRLFNKQADTQENSFETLNSAENRLKRIITLVQKTEFILERYKGVAISFRKTSPMIVCPNNPLLEIRLEVIDQFYCNLVSLLYDHIIPEEDQPVMDAIQELREDRNLAGILDKKDVLEYIEILEKLFPEMSSAHLKRLLSLHTTPNLGIDTIMKT
jgi:hypothetical protein